MQGKSSAVRGKSLIDREIKKRAFFALVSQDWFSYAFSTLLDVSACSDDFWPTELPIDRFTVRISFCFLAPTVLTRSLAAIQPSQIKTPLPINAHDSDLAAGFSGPQPVTSYTLVGTMIIWYRIARALFPALQHLQSETTPSYQLLLEADRQLQGVIDGAPPWLLEGGPRENMPPPVEWMRNTFQSVPLSDLSTLSLSLIDFSQNVVCP